MDTSAALDEALAQDHVILFIAVEMNLPSGDVLLLDGSGEVTWSEGTFKGIHPTFGTIDNIEAISDGLDEQAPAISVSFLPAEDADAAVVASSEQQGSRIRIWLGAIDWTTKAVVDEPYSMFDGELDQPTLSTNMGSRQVEMLCASSFERLFADDEGNRLNPACHKDIWPGETGLDAITGIERQLIWGPGDKISGSVPGAIIGGTTTTIFSNDINRSRGIGAFRS